MATDTKRLGNLFANVIRESQMLDTSGCMNVWASGFLLRLVGYLSLSDAERAKLLRLINSDGGGDSLEEKGESEAKGREEDGVGAVSTDAVAAQSSSAAGDDFVILTHDVVNVNELATEIVSADKSHAALLVAQMRRIVALEVRFTFLPPLFFSDFLRFLFD